MSHPHRRGEDALRGVLRALGEEVRRDFVTAAQQHGPYRVLRAIGAGATSEVFAAVRVDGAPSAEREGADSSSEAAVPYAIKVVRPGADVREVLARFGRERELVARVRHEGVVPVLEWGMTPDGRPWFAMPLIEGDPITVGADRLDLGLAARCALLRDAAEVVAAAHDAGVVHRDLKPGNILIEQRSEGRSRAVLLPRLIDFGIARALAGDLARLTPNDHAHRMGTPGYMPPEQSRDGIAACDARSDVFALGVVLGEMLAGIVPREPAATIRGRPRAILPPSVAVEHWSQRDRAAADAAARHRGFAHADELATVLRETYDALFAAATAANPAQRPANAGALASALGAWC